MAERSIAAPDSAEVARLRRGFHGGRARSLSLSSQYGAGTPEGGTHEQRRGAHQPDARRIMQGPAGPPRTWCWARDTVSSSTARWPRSVLSTACRRTTGVLVATYQPSEPATSTST